MHGQVKVMGETQADLLLLLAQDRDRLGQLAHT